jgi:hypothetical protein
VLKIKFVGVVIYEKKRFEAKVDTRKFFCPKKVGEST